MVQFDPSKLKLDGIKNGKTQVSGSGFKIDERAKLDAEIQSCFRSSSASEESELGLFSSSTKTSKTDKSQSSKKASKTSKSNKEGKISREQQIDNIVKGSHGKISKEEAATILNRARAVIKERKDARAELDKKKASNGLTYKQAREIIDKVEKYVSQFDSKRTGDAMVDALRQNNNPYRKAVNGQRGVIHTVHYEINADKLPPDMKAEYQKAKAAVNEIRQNNSDLVDTIDPDIGGIRLLSGEFDKWYEEQYGSVD